MESVSLALAKHIAASINKGIEEDKKRAEELGLPHDPFFYAADIFQMIDEFNKA